MNDAVKRVLFVNSEIFPYVPENHASSIGRCLPQGIQERKKEIRSFMPRYGCINERKNQLHEVIRLSGMNLIISDVDRPLIIKVASITAARIQVYFIENDDYFKRKQLYCDDEGKFFADNDERAIFFARGVLETVKKLRWAPDVIHCHGWISQLVPLYLKKSYKDDPIFSNCKVVTSLYSDTPGSAFASDFSSKLAIGDISAEDVPFLKEPDGINLAKTAIQCSDGIILGDADVNKQLISYGKELGIPILEYNEDSYKDGKYVEEYDSFYNAL